MTPSTTSATSTPNTSNTPSPPFERGMMRNRHRPLIRLYKKEPRAAMITDGARTSRSSLTEHDPVHGELVIGTSMPITVPVSIHAAVGGDHDGPNPGDFLAAALTSCFDTTMRVVADRLGIVLTALEVAVAAEVDVRGTLMVDATVPVGFQRMTLSIDFEAQEGTPQPALDMLLATADHCCVVMQTLKNGVGVRTVVNGTAS